MAPPAKIKGLYPIDDKSKMFRNVENYKERKRFSRSKLWKKGFFMIEIKKVGSYEKKEVLCDRKHF